MRDPHYKSVAIIVAHPDDEALWAGGTMLSYPDWHCFVVCLCRGSDPERAPRFRRALQALEAEGAIGDLDDGPDQPPQPESVVEQAILDLLPRKPWDLVLTHSPSGEYTRHLRHEETSKAVISLWHSGKIAARELWLFAYEDGNKAYLPKAMIGAPIFHQLLHSIWAKKHQIIARTYGFRPGSFEEETTPTAEAFWRFSDSPAAVNWLNKHLKSDINVIL